MQVATVLSMTNITLNMFGTKNLAINANVVDLLNALVSDQSFSPEYAGNNERKLGEFNREWFISEATSAQLESENYIYFKRKSAPKYTAYCKPGTKPFIGITFDSKLAKKYYPELLEWSQSIVSSFTPDYAVLAPISKYVNNPTTEIDKLRNQFRLNTFTVPGTYYEGGPPGIGIFTWLGPHYISQLDNDHLKATPNLNSKRQDWGGYFLSFDSDNPWPVDETFLKTKWLPATEYLANTKVFAEHYQDENNVPRRRKGDNCIVGGVVDPSSV